MRTEIVVARYNEDLSWIPFESADQVTVYNKGLPMDQLVLPKNARVIDLPNVGREAHTYLYHIREHYNDLAQTTVFLQGSIDDHMQFLNICTSKFQFITWLMQNMEKGLSQNFVVVPRAYSWAPSWSFKILEWGGRALADSGMLFGQWFNTHIRHWTDANDLLPFRWYLGGIFAVARENIQQHPWVYYDRLIKTLEHDNAPEEAHFMERAWYKMLEFDPPVIL